MALTDQLGRVVERNEYDDYGAPRFFNAAGAAIGQSAVNNALLFAGREYDAESGFYYFRARHMDPEAGRFLTRNPLGAWFDSAHAGNASTFAANSPWTWFDPTGLPSTIDRRDIIVVAQAPDKRSGKPKEIVVVGSKVKERAAAGVRFDVADLKGLLSESLAGEHEFGHWLGTYYGSGAARRGYNAYYASIRNDVKGVQARFLNVDLPDTASRGNPFAYQGGMFFGQGAMHQSGQATGKRQHRPIAIRAYYDQAGAPSAGHDALYYFSSSPTVAAGNCVADGLGGCLKKLAAGTPQAAKEKWYRHKPHVNVGTIGFVPSPSGMGGLGLSSGLGRLPGQHCFTEPLSQKQICVSWPDPPCCVGDEISIILYP
jgi:RHS repeat-associated protein